MREIFIKQTGNLRLHDRRKKKFSALNLGEYFSSRSELNGIEINDGNFFMSSDTLFIFFAWVISFHCWNSLWERLVSGYESSNYMLLQWDLYCQQVNLFPRVVPENSHIIWIQKTTALLNTYMTCIKDTIIPCVNNMNNVTEQSSKLSFGHEMLSVSVH